MGAFKLIRRDGSRFFRRHPFPVNHQFLLTQPRQIQNILHHLQQTVGFLFQILHMRCHILRTADTGSLHSTGRTLQLFQHHVAFQLHPGKRGADIMGNGRQQTASLLLTHSQFQRLFLFILTDAPGHRQSGAFTQCIQQMPPGRGKRLHQTVFQHQCRESGFAQGNAALPGSGSG